MSKRVLIAAGGTGGHLYPALGTVAKLLECEPTLEVLFAGGGLDTNPFFKDTMYPYRPISAAPLARQTPWNFLKHGGIIAKGIWQSRDLLQSFKPHLVVGFGSYHTFPVLSAARMLRYPMILHEQNSKPGKVIRLFSKYALMTGIYFPAASHSLKGKSMLLSMPLRKVFSSTPSNKEEAYSYFGISPNLCTLLVFGGSQGAQFINREVTKLLTRMKGIDFQVLHFTGNANEAQMVADLYSTSNVKAIVKPWEERMDYAWQVADLAIVRAGASTIAEQIEFEVPAIYIPYPFAADGHQESNADFVVDSIRGGWKWREEHWVPDHLLAVLPLLLRKNSSHLAEKRNNLALYKKTAVSSELFTEILKNIYLDASLAL